MIVFSKNKTFFDLNEIVNVVRRALCHQKKGTFENLGGGTCPQCPPFLRHCCHQLLLIHFYQLSTTLILSHQLSSTPINSHPRLTEA
jgi:hypothetical protein